MDNRLSTLTQRIETDQAARAFVAHGLAGFVGKGDATIREAHLARCIGRAQADLILKSAVVGHDTSSEVGALRPSAQAFLAAVDRVSVLGRLAEALRLDPNTSGRLQTTNPTSEWVEQGARKPITSMGFDQMDLMPRKIVSTIVVSDELVRPVAPSTLTSLTRSLASATATGIDTAALDPTSAATAGRPASLTSAGTEVAASGDLATDVGRLLAAISDGQAVAPYLVAGWSRAAMLATMLAGLQQLGVGVLCCSPARRATC